MPVRVALTGGIATGKSYVLRRFQELGVPTIDADRLAREAVAPGTPGLRAVVDAFGSSILDASGAIDRKRLGTIVFADEARRRALEAIVHPEVRRAIDAWYAALDPAAKFAIADIPLLYETGRDRDFDVVIVTACAPDEQVARLAARDGLTAEEARRRLDAQLPIAEKVTRADYVVDTGGSFADTDRQVRDVFQQLTASNPPG